MNRVYRMQTTKLLNYQTTKFSNYQAKFQGLGITLATDVSDITLAMDVSAITFFVVETLYFRGGILNTAIDNQCHRKYEKE